MNERFFNRIPVLEAYLGKDTFVQVHIDGPLNVVAVDRLIKYLEVLTECLKADAEQAENRNASDVISETSKATDSQVQEKGGE